jgi:hypothetical protein
MASFDWAQINADYKAGQPSRNADQLFALQSELGQETAPSNISSLNREINRVKKTPMAAPVEANPFDQENPFSSPNIPTSGAVPAIEGTNPFEQTNPFETSTPTAEPGFWGNVAGGVGAAADYLAGAPAAAAGAIAGMGTLAASGGDVSGAKGVMSETMGGGMPTSLLKKYTGIDVTENPTYKTAMWPVEKVMQLGDFAAHGYYQLAKAAGMSDENAQKIEDSLKLGTMSILGAKAMIHSFSPKRKTVVETTPEVSKADAIISKRPIIEPNPFDQAEPETPALPETMYADQRGVITPELPSEAMQLAKERADRAQKAPETPAPIQAELFPPETNMHRPYTDIRAATETGGERPLTPEEFAQVHENLAAESATAHEVPPDMGVAYQKYLEQVSGKQADMFDIGSRQETFAKTVARLVEDHPFVKNAEQQLAKQEQFVSDLKDQVASGETTATALITEIKALEQAKEKVATVRENVSTALTKGEVPKSPFKGRGGRQAGAIDINGIGTSVEAGIKNLNEFVKKALTFNFKHTTHKDDYLNKLIPETKAAAVNFLKPEDIATTLSKVLDPKATDTPPIWSSWQSGLQATALKFKNNPLMMALSNHLNYGYHQGQYQVSKLVTPLVKYLSTMPMKEFGELHDLIKTEMFKEQRLTDAELNDNYTPKQVGAYKMMRAAFDTAHEIQNAALKKLGKKELTKGEAFLASTWHGDYHTPIMTKALNANGKPSLAWYIRTTTRAEGHLALDHLRKTMGDVLDIPDSLKPEYRPSTRNPNTPHDVVGAYHDMMDYFQKTPELANQVEAALKDYITSKGYTVAGQNKHFMSKGNIRGFEGDRPWLSAEVNAKAGMKSQMDYLKSSLKWSSAQESIANMKELLANPDINAKMPNAVEYGTSVLNNELGSTSAYTTALENAIAKYVPSSLAPNKLFKPENYGVSRTSMYHTSADIKSAAYMQALGASVMYMIATPLQFVLSAPAMHRVLSNQGYSHSILKTSLLATADAMSGIVSHLAHELGVKGEFVPSTDFGKRALKYQEDSGSVSKNMFDESAGLEAHAPVQTLAKGLGWSIGLPEKVARQAAFMSFAHHLKASGKFTNEMEMFHKAEQITEDTLGSFKSFDRPQIVKKLGILGEQESQFKLFAFRELNKLGAFTRMASDYIGSGGKSGAVSPLLAFAGMYALMGGVQNFPGMKQLDGLVNMIKDYIAAEHPEYYYKMPSKTISESLVGMLPESSGIRDIARSGVAATMTNLALPNRLDLSPIDIEHPFKGLAPATGQDIKELGSIFTAATHPTTSAAWIQALHVNGFPGLKGLMETKMDIYKGDKQGENQAYMNPTDIMNPKEGAGLVRTPEETGIRSVGGMANTEAVRKKAIYESTAEQRRTTQAKQTLVDRIARGLHENNPDLIAESSKAFLRITPDDRALDSAINTRLMELHFTPQQIQAMKLSGMGSIQNYQRLKEFSK